MQSPPFWLVEQVAPSRQGPLQQPVDFEALVRRIRDEVHNVRYKRESGTHEAKGSWRPVIRFDIERDSFDQFFNNPYGYRGQFLIDPQTGNAANAHALSIIAATLLNHTNLEPPIAEQAHRSLLSCYAKLWIDEDQHDPATPDLLVQVVVPTWQAAAEAVRARLDAHDPTLTPKEIDRIFGVRAPEGITLKAIGAWVGADGSLSVVASKLTRAEDIHAYGVS